MTIITRRQALLAPIAALLASCCQQTRNSPTGVAVEYSLRDFAEFFAQAETKHPETGALLEPEQLKVFAASWDGRGQVCAVIHAPRLLAARIQAHALRQLGETLLADAWSPDGRAWCLFAHGDVDAIKGVLREPKRRPAS